MALAPKLLMTHPIPSSPSLQNNNLSFLDGIMTYVHDSEVVVVESGGALKSLSSPMQEDVHICQSIYIHFQGETTLVIASSAGIKLCDRTGRRVHFTLTIQQLNRMIGHEIQYVQGVAALGANQVAFGTSAGEILVLEFPLAVTEQPALSRVISVGSVPTCLASDQEHFVCGCADGSVLAFEIETFAQCLRIPANKISSPCTSIAVRSRVVVASFSTGHLRFYRLFVDETAVEVAAHVRPITQLALHPTRPLVASCSDDQHLSIWTFPDFKSQATSQVDLLLCEKLPNALLTGIALWEETTGATHIMVVAYDTPLSYIWVTEAS